MFSHKDTWGDHEIYSYDYTKHPFIRYFKDLYDEENLEMLHLKSEDYQYLKYKLDLGGLSEIDTDLHTRFYSDIKSNLVFKKLYCSFIKDIYIHFFPNEKHMIFQGFPSVRFQFMKSVTVPPHKDSDGLSNHPVGEKNFLIPLTEMSNTNSIFIESEPDKGDFKSIELKPGDLYYFNANKCMHYNKPNDEGKLRVSLDFRIILLDDYFKYVNGTTMVNKTNPRDLHRKRDPTSMTIGGYYQYFNRDSTIDEMCNWYKTTPIMQHRPTFGKEEAEAAYRYMLEDSFITEHGKTAELERIICEYIGCKYCIMTTSGTTAIILGLLPLDIVEGDQVIFPNYTMIATINDIKLLKLKPVIVDVDYDTYTLTVDTIRSNITDRTRAVIHVSLNNRSRNIEHISEYCSSHNIFMLEDSAQSLGCRTNGKHFGTFGEIGCFSLSTPKIISTGQGGFCVTDDSGLATKMRMIKNFGRRESGKDNFEVFGINLKYTDLQAVIGIEQMKKLDFRVKKMRDIYDLYYKELKDTVKMIKPLNDEWIPWFVDIYIEKREELMEFLNKHAVQTRPVYGEINKTNIYYSDVILPNSNTVCNHGLFLPSHVTIKDDDIKQICKLTKLFYISHSN